MTEHFAPFDASQHLDDGEVIAEYLAAAAETGDPTFFITALGDVAKAHGMAQIAKDAGLGRESLYKALNGDTQPRFETISAVMRALGVRFSVVAENHHPG